MLDEQRLVVKSMPLDEPTSAPTLTPEQEYAAVLAQRNGNGRAVRRATRSDRSPLSARRVSPPIAASASVSSEGASATETAAPETTTRLDSIHFADETLAGLGFVDDQIVDDDEVTWSAERLTGSESLID